MWLISDAQGQTGCQGNKLEMAKEGALGKLYILLNGKWKAFQKKPAFVYMIVAEVWTMRHNAVPSRGRAEAEPAFC